VDVLDENASNSAEDNGGGVLRTGGAKVATGLAQTVRGTWSMFAGQYLEAGDDSTGQQTSLVELTAELSVGNNTSILLRV
jgi:hypothetical protein